jgi:hypothetical protein
MICQRAAAVLRGLEKNELAVTAEEIELLLEHGLAVEADPDDLQTLHWLQPLVRQYAGCDVDAPLASQSLAVTLRETEEELKKDWYRLKASKETLAAREQSRIAMRRAIAYLNDRTAMEAVRKLMRNARQLAPGATYTCCEPLGSEYYAITHKGFRVRRQLKLRLERFGQAPLATFLATFDKTEAKMRAFSTEIATLSQNIGYVRKNPEQVVIGLAKTGAPAAQALGAYRAGLQAARDAPDIAVICARNAKAFGGPAQAAKGLRQAQHALRHAGFPSTPIAMGAAKSLLTFTPPAAGAPRFADLFRRLEQGLGRDEVNFKYTARLMPATGTPEQLVRRVLAACNLLSQMPSRVKPNAREVRATAVALSAMVRQDDQLAALVARYREVEYELVRAGVSTIATVEGHALECVGCPGSPAEVVDIVAALAGQLAAGRQGERSDVSIAVAFAKRFAF